mgnify:CR=1 FL=1
MGLKSCAIRHINVLSEGFLTANSQGFLHPLLINKVWLGEKNLQIKIFTRITDDIEDCDFLLIDSKYFRFEWESKPEQ